MWDEKCSTWAVYYTSRRYNTLQHTAPHCNICITLQHSATHHKNVVHTMWDVRCSTWAVLRITLLQFTATHCNKLRHTATHCITHCNTRQHTATHCNTLQHTATHCNTLQHTATRCNTWYRTATYCITLQHTTTRSTYEERCVLFYKGSSANHVVSTYCNALKDNTRHCNPL